MELAIDPTDLQQALLAWFRRERRDLPWRRTHDPYAIWVSEIMLQQTQVNTVIPYYERFLARFPDVNALASAPLDELLALWEGLGYYSRARHLHAAAQQVCDRLGGQIPGEWRELRALPGIGDYTAAAILSIAYGQDHAAVDGNIQRVLCRLSDYAEDPRSGSGKKTIQSLADRLLPAGQAGGWNQALMELGALICQPRQPQCTSCPVGPFCLALARGVQEQRPLARVRPRPPLHVLAAALIVREDGLLIVRRKPQGLLGGLWELPNGQVESGETHEQALERLLGALGLQANLQPEIARVRHAYSHFRVVVHVLPCQVQGSPTPEGAWDACHWLAPGEEPDYGLTGVTTKILARVPRPGSQMLL